MKAMQHSWGLSSRLTQDRQKWRDFVAVLNTTGCNGYEDDDDDDDDDIFTLC